MENFLTFVFEALHSNGIQTVVKENPEFFEKGKLWKIGLIGYLKPCAFQRAFCFPRFKVETVESFIQVFNVFSTGFSTDFIILRSNEKTKGNRTQPH